MVLGKDRKSLASFSGLKVVSNEKTGRIGKESNVRIWFRTVAIEDYFKFDNAVFE
jgi:hypothetical protein